MGAAHSSVPLAGQHRIEGGFCRAISVPLLAAVALIGLGLRAPSRAQQDTMSFFVTSVGNGIGADLGGLAGADAHCQTLAQAAGSTKANWRAYLSTTEPGGAAGVNARDRIGKGPWRNAKGVLVAKSVEDLHGVTGVPIRSDPISKAAPMVHKCHSCCFL
jgi:hypothetical protein